MGRPTPRAIHWEVALRHSCTACGRTDHWGKGWIGYPLWDSIRGRHSVPADVDSVAFCSAECRDRVTDYRPPRWMDVGREPNRPSEYMQALWRAQQSAKADNHRRFPMPDHGKAEKGKCKWCGGRITNGPGERRVYWHPGCLESYWLHTDMNAQRNFLIRRDGKRCFDCGATGIDLQVEHDVPLWKVADLPPDERRPYFGPDNLRLRGTECCHRAKSAREAAERAQMRRGQ